MLKKSVYPTLVVILLLGWYVHRTAVKHGNDSTSSEARSTSEEVIANRTASEPPTTSSMVSTSHDHPLNERSRRWLDPVIIRALNSQTTWNEHGTEKKVVSIVETNFHRPYVRIEERYSVDLHTREEKLISYIPSAADTLLVKLGSEATDEEIQELETRLGVQFESELLGTNILKVRIDSFITIERIPSLLQALLKETRAIQTAEPDFLSRTFRNIPDDPLFDRQVGFDSRKDDGENRDIDAPEAWDFRTDASSITVAVIDSGINLSHLDLKENLWKNQQELANGIDDDGNGLIDDIHGANLIADSGDPEDDNGHGSLVAGIIGARGDNGIGVTGVAWQVQLMGLKHSNSFGIGFYSDGIEAIKYAIEQEVDIINNSWGGTGYSQLLKDTLDEASSEGILIVTAAGNEGNLLSDIPVYPAAYTIAHQVVVGSTNYNDSRASFSNYDPQLVHVMALENGLSTGSGNEEAYREESGTSFSAPYVAGAFAILKAEFPELSTPALIDRLLNAVESRVSLNTACLSKGRLNLNRALLGSTNVPLNDLFSNATDLDAEGATISDSLTFATLEPNEPRSEATLDPQTVWYKWHAPRSSRAIFELNTLNFTGSLAIYQGSQLNQLRLISSAQSTSSDRPSSIDLNAIQDEVYYIQLGRKGGEGGYFTLRLGLAPENDLIDAAKVLVGESFDTTGSLYFATREVDEPSIHPSGAGTTVWYAWEPPRDGPFLVSVFSTAGQLFHRIFNGSPLNDEIVNPGSDPARTTSLIEVSEGQTYYLGIDAQSEQGNTFQLEGHYLETPEITIEPNDVLSSVGGEALFNVGVLSLGEPAYQWNHDNEPIPGATQSFLYLTDLGYSDAGAYNVDISIGDFTLRSRTAFLTLEEIRLQILRRPESTIVSVGSTLDLSTFVQPLGLATFVWYKDRIKIEGATGNSYQLANVQFEDTGLYEVEIFFEGSLVDRFEAPVRVIEGDSIVSGTAWQNTGVGNPRFGRIRKAGDYVFALAERNRFGFSSNGSVWQYASIDRSDRINWIEYGDGRYVIADQLGIFTSTDLYNWEEANVDASGVQQVAYGNGIFVAAASDHVYRSTDGIAWAELEPPGSSSLSAVTWAADKFIMLDNAKEVYSSVDGLSWNNIGTSNLLDPYEIVYEDGVFWGTRNDLETSTDGISWSKTGMPGSWLGGFAIDPDTNRRYVLTDTGFWEKADSWERVQDTTEIGGIVGLAVLNGEAVVTIDGFPQLLSEYNPEIRQIERFHEIGFVNGKFLANSAGDYYQSEDGINWSLINSNLPWLLDRHVAYGNGIYVFRSAWGPSLNSLSENTVDFKSIAFGNGRFVGLAGLRLLSSEDGQNWVEVGTVEASISKDLIFADGKFLYMDQSTIRTSTNGLSWEVTNVSSPRFESIIYGGDTFLRSSGGATVWTSTDGLSWQSASLSYDGQSPGITDVAYFNRHFYALANGIIFESPDGISWSAINFEAQGYDAMELESGNNRLVMLTDVGPVTWRGTLEDSSGPILTLRGPSSGTKLTMGDRVTFNISSFSETAEISKVDILKDDSLVATLTSPIGSFSHRMESIGTTRLTFRATDTNGQTTDREVTLTGVRNLLAHLPGAGPMMRDIAYFKGAYYGAGPGGVIYQSLDGETWKSIQTQSPNDLTSFYYNDIGICAIGPPDVLLFSKDGIHWQRVPITNVSAFRGQFTSSFLVVPANFGHAWLSTNGYDWYSMETGQKVAGSTDVSAPNLPYEYVSLGELFLASPGKPAIDSPQPNPQNVAKLGSIVVGAEERKGVYRTLDGISWEDTTPSGLDRDDIAGAEAHGGTFFLFTHDRPKKSLTHISQDGRAWTPVDGPGLISNLIFNNGTFLGTDRHLIWQSQNGVDWEATSIGPDELVYSGGEIKLIASPKGLIMSEFDEGDYFRTSSSKDGVNWVTSEVPYFYRFEQVLGADDNLHAVSSFWTSYTYKPETSWTIGEARIGGEAVYGNGIFISQASDVGELRISMDGFEWDVIEDPWIAENRLDWLSFDGEKSFWYVSNDGSFLASSTDGFQWMEKTYPGYLYEQGRIIRFKDKLYVDGYVSEDDGITWQTSLQEEGEFWLASTKELLFAVILTNTNALHGYLNDGNGWVETPLPSGTRPWHVQATSELFFYVVGDLIYTSEDGVTWSIGAERLTKQMKSTIADDRFFLFGDEIAIREFSQTDLSISNVEASAETLGVGDNLNAIVEVTNSGLTTIDSGLTATIDLLLTQFSNHWGNQSDGSNNLKTIEVELPRLTPGQSSAFPVAITIPDTIKPGDFYLSAHISPTSDLPDYNGTNNFWLGDRVVANVPNLSLDLDWSGNGMVLSEKPLSNIPFKQQIQLIPRPDSGYQFSGWTGDVIPELEIADIMMDSDKSVSALFTARQFNVAIGIGGGGRVEGVPTSGYSNFGDILELQAHAENGWTFLGWFGDRVSEDTDLNITIGRDLQLTALFAQSFQTYLKEQYSEAQLEDPDVGGPLGDPDKNRFSNLQEFLFGMQPGSGSPPLFEVYRRGEYMCLLYPRSLTTIGDERLEVWHSSDLHSWDDSGVTTQVVGTEGGIEYVEACVNHPEDDPLFFEIRAVTE